MGQVISSHTNFLYLKSPRGASKINQIALYTHHKILYGVQRPIKAIKQSNTMALPFF